VSLEGSDAARRQMKRESHRSMQEFSLDAFDALEEIVARNFARFGDGRDDRLWSFGPYGHLVGMKVSALGTGAGADCSVQVHDRSRFEFVDLDREPLPCELVGRVDCDHSPRDVDLAIALNGEIVATTRTYRTADGVPRSLWSALLPDRSLRAGNNELEIFVLSSNGRGETILVPPR
jgi:hypothetical protein